ANSITIYANGSNGNSPPIAAIAGSNTGLQVPYGVAFDSSGNIYVANFISDSITVYPSGASGNVAPTTTIAGANTRLKSPAGIALDANNNIYVANFAVNTGVASVTVYAAGSTGNATPSFSISGANTTLNGPF